MPPKSALYFDIETGGFRGANNPVLSISWAHNQEEVKSIYADPTPGTRMSRWSERKIWEPIRKAGYSRTSEKETLLRFLRVLEGAPEGTQLVGWNIGYSPIPQEVARTAGFDVPFLVSRARALGLEDRYRKALNRLRIHDEGALWAYRIARNVVQGPGAQMVQQGRLHQDVYMEAVGYMKQAGKFAAMHGLTTEEEIAESLSRAGIRFAGWKQESTYRLLFGEELRGAHQSAEDVKATRRIMQSAPAELSEEFIEKWGRETLENKLVSSLKAVKTGAGPERYWAAMQTAEEWGVRTGVESKLAQLAEESGISLASIRAGRGIPTIERTIRRGVVSEVVERMGATRAAGLFELATRKNWGKIAVGVGVAGLAFAQPGQWFSGKDDEYNTIEGLRHGGEAERMRRLLTDFGSGFTGLLTIPKTLATAFAKARGVPAEAGVEFGFREFSGVVGGMRKYLGENITKAQSLGLKKLEREAAIAAEQGFVSVATVNPEVTRKVAASLGVSPHQAKTAAIRHERFHQAVTHLGLREKIIEATPRMATSMESFLKGRGAGYLKAGYKPEMLTEEFLAGAVEYGTYSKGPAAFGVKKYGEQFARIQELVTKLPTIKPRYLTQKSSLTRRTMMRENMLQILGFTEPAKKIAVGVKKQPLGQTFVQRPLGEAFKDAPPPLPQRTTPPPIPKTGPTQGPPPLPKQKVSTPPPLPTTNTVKSNVGVAAQKMRNKLSDFKSPIDLDSAVNRAERMYEGIPVAPKFKSSILEPGNQKTKRKMRMQAKHREAMVRHSVNCLRPGKRHRYQAGRLVV